MKLYTSALIILFPLLGLTQPVTNSAVIRELSFQVGDGVQYEYSVSTRQLNDDPEDWTTAFGVVPKGSSRILVATGDRKAFALGEVVGPARRALTNYFPNPRFPPDETYGLKILEYRATMLGDWQYSTFSDPAFETKAEFYLGLRIVADTGIHYGWVHFGRSSVDSHTAFDILGVQISPVADTPIAAGEFPELPPIVPQLNGNELTFSWDPRWGVLVLQTTTNILSPVHWEDVVESTGGPVQIDQLDSQRYFRLVSP